MRTGTSVSYCVFVRNWWRKDEYGHVVPYSGAPKRTLARRCTEREAVEICKHYNDTHKPGWRSRKAEFERE